MGWIATSGVLLALACPPFELVVPSFVALVPFTVWVARLPPGAKGRSAALRGGFWLGLLYFTLVFYWLLASLIYYTPLAVLAFLLPVLIMSGFLALATLGIHASMERWGGPIWLFLPLFWTATEWVRAHLGPVSFPWMELGATLTEAPRLLGAADLVGTRGLTVWLALVNGLLAEAWLRWGGGGRAAAAGRVSGRVALPLLGAVAALAGPLLYSLHRWETLEPEPMARVGVVQPNIPEDLKMEREAATDSALRAVATLVRRSGMAAADVDLVLLPETVFPQFPDAIPTLDYPGMPALRRWVGELARNADAAVLYGALGAETRPETGRGYVPFNSAFLVDRSGERIATYDKINLVPVVERVPFVPPEWFDGLTYFGAFGVGERPGVVPLPGATRTDPGGDPGVQLRDVRFGVLVCYESIFAEQSRRYRRAGADFLVNITNDAWFGREEPFWARTSALWQHPAHLVMRAVENRMGVARAANTGISGLVDPLGRVAHETELFTAAAFTGTVYTTDAVTVFTRWGDWLATAATAGAVLAAVLAALRGPGAGRGPGPRAGRQERNPRSRDGTEK